MTGFTFGDNARVKVEDGLEVDLSRTEFVEIGIDFSGTYVSDKGTISYSEKDRKWELHVCVIDGVVHWGLRA